MKTALPHRLCAVLAAVLLAGCTVSAPRAPARHTLNDPDSAASVQGGGAAFANSLDHPDSRYYVVNDFYNMKSGGSLHLLEQFATYQQTTEFSCACASALMVLHWYGVTDYDELTLCEMAGTDPETGTTPEALAALFEGLGWQVEAHIAPEPAFDSAEAWAQYLTARIDEGTPVLVDWQDWGGHWQVVIGVDGCGTDSVWDDVMIFADPYDVTDHYQDGYYTYPLGRFFTMWAEGHAEGRAPCAQPYLAARP